jgi:DNA-binding beta-propeller fold protein YncE
VKRLPNSFLAGLFILGTLVAPSRLAGAPPATARLSFQTVALPGATAPAALDYLAYEPGRNRVWVPVGSTGSVAVYDIATRTFRSVGGFATADEEVDGKKRTLGPSSVAIGNGFAYVGDRADGRICAIDTASLKTGDCTPLASPPDGVAYVASAKEVWVTLPRVDSIAVLDASRPGTLTPKTVIKVDGQPEGYASDPDRGVFFTNLEDAGKTLVIDVVTHAVVRTWNLDCDTRGPRGVAEDPVRGFVFAACSDHVLVLD